MKKLVLLLIVFSTITVSAQKAKPLFNEDLSNAMYDKSVWTLSEGVLSATEDKEIWTVAEYENFKLDLEFKTDTGTNSGVIVYCTDRGNWIPNSVEVQIADDYSEKWATAPTNFQSGAIFGHLPASEQKVVKRPGEWNKMSVVCKGQQITVTLNGKKVTEMDMSKWTSGKKNPDGSDIPSWLPTPFAKLATKGYIGLQGKHGDALIWFRNVKITPLK